MTLVPNASSTPAFASIRPVQWIAFSGRRPKRQTTTRTSSFRCPCNHSAAVRGIVDLAAHPTGMCL
jgi:hypothetical protein